MRLIIVDDDRLVVDSLKIILGAQPQIEVVGTGADGNDAVALYTEHAPDIALLDIQMPGRDGLSAAREILERDPAARVVFLTTFSDDEYIVSALKLGARGYLIKTDVAAIPPALAQVMDGKRVLEGKAIEDVDFDGAGAEAGTLTLIIGATEEQAAPVLPLLQTFGKKFFYFDAPGAGQTAKLCNQVSLASCMVGYADALALAEQGHLDAHKVLDLMASGTGGSGASASLAPKSLDGDYKPGFMAEHLRKDIALALRSAQEAELALPGAETAFALFDTLCQVGGARMGTQALTLLYAEEGDAAAAGLDWSLLDADADGCCCGGDEGGCGCGGCASFHSPPRHPGRSR